MATRLNNPSSMSNMLNVNELLVKIEEKPVLHHPSVTKRRISKKGNKRGKKPFICSKCQSGFVRKDNLKRHIATLHGETVTRLDNTERRTRCFYPGCTAEFYHKTKLILHIQQDHQIPCETENLYFEREEEFFAWKLREEQENYVYFSRSSGIRASKTAKYLYYECQRDGPIRSHRKRTEPLRKTGRRNSKGVVKSGAICTARIQARINPSGEVNVSYYKTHNHPVNFEDTRHHPIPRHVKDEIKAKLLTGVVADDIQKSIREGYGNRNNRRENIYGRKKHIVSKRLIESIRRKLSAVKSVPDDTALAFDTLVERLRSEKYNPVLIYERENLGEDCSMQPVVLVQNSFSLGIQTQEQMEMFTACADKFVYITETKLWSQDNIVIVAVMVIRQECKKACPVAYLISNCVEELVLLRFFAALKERTLPTPDVETLITSDNSYIGSSFRSVFGNITNCFLCEWQLHRDWIRMSKEHFSDAEVWNKAYLCLVSLLQEMDVSRFKSMCELFVVTLKQKFKLFTNYFITTYMSRVENWARCYRTKGALKVNLQLFIDAFDKRLKPLFNKSKQRRALKNIISRLLLMEEEDYRHQIDVEAVADHFVEPTLSEHECALAADDVYIFQLSPASWLWKTSKDREYCVTRQKEICDNELCFEKCLKPPCLFLCNHMYVCSCGNKDFLCEHVHKVHSSQTESALHFESNLQAVMQSKVTFSDTVDGIDKHQSIVGSGTSDNDESKHIEKEENMLQSFITLESSSVGEGSTATRVFTIERVQQNLKTISSYLSNEDVLRVALPHLDVVLEHLVHQCKAMSESSS